MTVSFVVPVRNDVRRLERCLAAIRSQRGADAVVETIVVDHGSSDGSAELARSKGARVLQETAGPVSRLRNLGGREARGEAIVFVDADHEIAPGWLQAAQDVFVDPTVGAAGLPYSAPPGANWVQRCYDLLRDRPGARSDVDWLGSGNLAVRRAAYERVGGFDETLEACEDVDFCRRVRAGGWRLVADPGMGSVHHGDPASLRQVFRSELWRGRDNVRVSLRAPRSWRGVVTALIPTWQMVGAVATVLALPLAWWGMRWPAPTLGVAAVAPSFLRAARLWWRAPSQDLSTAWRVVALALAYDWGRAFALAHRAPHHREAFERGASGGAKA